MGNPITIPTKLSRRPAQTIRLLPAACMELIIPRTSPAPPTIPTTIIPGVDSAQRFKDSYTKLFIKHENPVEGSRLYNPSTIHAIPIQIVFRTGFSSMFFSRFGCFLSASVAGSGA